MNTEIAQKAYQALDHNGVVTVILKNGVVYENLLVQVVTNTVVRGGNASFIFKGSLPDGKTIEIHSTDIANIVL